MPTEEQQGIIADTTVTNAERKVIAALLVDSTRVSSHIFLRLTKDDFSAKKYALIFEVANEFHQQGKEINGDVIANVLVDRNKSPLIFDGDIQTCVLEICNWHTSSEAIEEYVNIVKKASIVRSLTNFANRLKDKKFDVIKFDEDLKKQQLEFERLLSENETSNLLRIDSAFNDFELKFEECLSGKVVTGVGSGFHKIDKLTGGWKGGELIIVAARPGKGKTAFALNLAIGAAQQCSDNEYVVFFSLEMGTDQIIHRLLSIKSKISFSLSNAQYLTPSNVAKIRSTIQRERRSNMYISENGDLDVLQIHNHLKKLIASGIKPKLVIVDYLQLIRPVQQFTRASNRQEEVSFISRNLKLTARLLDVPIVACAQLSRKIEERGTKGRDAIPQLSDLRESGAIEQDADIVSFLYNEAENESNQDEKFGKNKREEEKFAYTKDAIDCNWLLAKNRNGPTGIVPLRFNRTTSSFTIRAIQEQDQQEN